MRDIQDRLTLTRALNAIERRLLAEPTSVALHFDRARCIEALGREGDALRAYGDVLALDPSHVRAMNAFGLLLLSADGAAEAEHVFAQAVARHPHDVESHTNLAFVRAKRGEGASARELYESALRLDPSCALAHHGLAAVLEALGEPAAARSHRELGFTYRPITALRYRGRGTAARVLVLGTAADGNVATQGLLDDRTFLTYALVVEHYDAAIPLPPHDVVFNAIGEADGCAPQLAAAARLLAATGAPVINHPRIVLATGRAENAHRLGQLEDVVTPAIVRFSRNESSLAARLAEHGVHVPFLVRALGYHGGDHFLRIDALDQLPGALAQLPGDDLLALSFLDARGPDGNVRKYRLMIVDGALFPLHLAIGDRWKLHYFSADMANVPSHRAEEAAFLAGMRARLGARATAALERVRDALGLDYGGIDFGLDHAGRVLLFEANATMVVPAPDPDPAFAYRRPAIERIVAAVRTMLLGRARRPLRGAID